MPKSEADRLGVTVVPLSVSFGREVFFDGDLSHHDYWEKTKGPFWPKTSQPSVRAFEEAFEALVDGESQVLCVTLTSQHSGTYNSASTVAQRFGDRVTVVDSLSVSSGLAWQVEAAVEAAREGMELHDIVPVIEEMARRTRLFAVLDTIECVRKGRRVDKVMPALGRLMREINDELIGNLWLLDSDPCGEG